MSSTRPAAGYPCPHSGVWSLGSQFQKLAPQRPGTSQLPPELLGSGTVQVTFPAVPVESIDDIGGWQWIGALRGWTVVHAWGDAG